MPFVNRNTVKSDGGGYRSGGTKKPTNTGIYGSYYGGASAGKTGSSLGVYGTTTAKPATTTAKPITSGNANSYNNGLYGSYYGGASAGKTGSGLGLYGSNYGGSVATPATTAKTSGLRTLAPTAPSGINSAKPASVGTGAQIGDYNKAKAIGQNLMNNSGNSKEEVNQRAVNVANAKKAEDLAKPEGGSLVDRTIDAVNEAKEKYLTTNNNSGGGTPSGGSGGGSRGGSGGGSGGGGGATVENTTTTTEQTDAKTEQDNTLEKIKELLTEQQKQAEDRYKTLYEQELAKNKQAWEGNRNQINLNYKRGQRFADATYGNELTGAGLTNRMRLLSNYMNNLNTNRLNYANNDATALANYNANKSNAYGTLAQGWYNYILPTYTNRVQNDDDYSYRRSLVESGLL